MKTLFFVAAQSKATGRCINRCFNASNIDEARAAFTRGLRFWSDKTFEIYSVGVASEAQIYAHFERLIDAEALNAVDALEKTLRAIDRRTAWLNNPRKAV